MISCQPARSPAPALHRYLYGIKKNTKAVRRADSFVARGLCGVIELDNRHSHLLHNAEALRWLKRTNETKEDFISYFSSGNLSMSD